MPSVTGRVIEQYTGQPVRGATVRAGGGMALTDSEGRFNLISSYGTTNLKITHRDFHPYVRSLVISHVLNMGDISIQSKVVAL